MHFSTDNDALGKPPTSPIMPHCERSSSSKMDPMLYKYSEQQWTAVYIELSHLRFQIDKNLHHDQAMLK